MSPVDNAPNVNIVIYKRIVAGDLSKFTATSNVTQSGGGARDLRFSPAEKFLPIFQRMFTACDETGKLRGFFSWADHENTEVFIHPPTSSRPNEVRIGCIHECFPANVIPDSAVDCILLIVLDNNGRIYPYFTSQQSLQHDNWHPAIKNPILEGLNARRSAKITAMGYIDVANERSYTNGQI